MDKISQAFTKDNINIFCKGLTKHNINTFCKGFTKHNINTFSEKPHKNSSKDIQKTY